MDTSLSQEPPHSTDPSPALHDRRDQAQPTCVITGGAGFVGRHLVQALLRDASVPWHVVVFDLRPYDQEGPADGVTSVVGDITRLGDVLLALTNASVVIHAASANPLDNKNKSLMRRVNVDGTKNVIEACKQCGVHRLIYISSASVVFDGSSLLRVDETRPYPKRYIDYYSETKAEAEKLVLAANKLSLATCAIRPSAVFGEGDREFVPRVAEVGRSGNSKFAIGDGSILWDFTYAGNLAHACVLVASKLTHESRIAGQAYFVTNAEPRRFWEITGKIQSHLGYPPPSVYIPFWICFVLASFVDMVLSIIRPIYVPKKPINFTRERVRLMTCHRTFSCEKAKHDFGYVPQVSVDIALLRTLATYSHLASPSVRKSIQSSTAA